MSAVRTRSSDQVLVERAVVALGRSSPHTVAFGGLAHDGAVHVSAISGEHTQSIEGLVVREHRGLGGRAMVESRPRLALDYRTSRTITHDYDAAILGARIVTLVAVPVVVSGRPRGMLYCGSRRSAEIGGAIAQPTIAAADDLAAQLRLRDDLDRRVATMPPADARDAAALPPAAREELRASYAELRSIAATITDPAVRDRLSRLEQRWAALARDDAVDDGPSARLSPREIDVLACAALGATNAEIAATLALKEATVKSYLQSAMGKLDAGTRHAAVARARRAGILP